MPQARPARLPSSGRAGRAGPFDALNSLDEMDFKRLICSVLERKFRLIASPTDRTRDGGVDVIAYGARMEGNYQYWIEIKRKRKVTVDDVRRLQGVVAQSGSSESSSDRTDVGVLVSTGSFTKEARQEAGLTSPRVLTIDGNVLGQYCVELGFVRQSDSGEFLPVLEGPPARSRHEDFFDGADVKALIETSERIDRYVRPWIRESEHLPRSIVERGYYALIDSELSRYGMNLESFVHQLNASRDGALLRLTESTLPDLVMTLSRGRTSLEVKSGEQSVTIREPKLLWDCHCVQPAGEFLPRDRPADAADRRCPIHGNKAGAQLADMFRRGLVEVRASGARVLWQNVPDYWPPSIDSIVMLENLMAAGVHKLECNSVLDVGAGSGFLGIAFSKVNPTVKEVWFSD